MDYLAKLNPPQRAAVQHGLGPLLILAGAGSGKTRVLTHRMAYLIQEHGVHPGEIFAVTFTNKAAAEMRHRVMQLLGGFENQRSLWVSTFHSSCVRILRSEIERLDYQKNFTIYDDSDQLSVVKACLKELKINDQAFSPKVMQGRINKLKNDGIAAAEYQPTYGGPFEDAFQRVFERYTEVLQKSSAVDFADLILLSVKLFQKFPKVLDAYQDRFPFLMIDEYQDTNRCQYLLMRLLAQKHQNICAVGDEDQSIYRWRGADISNILGFERDFPNAKIFKLEENYRSTKNIIEAASRVIANNTERRDKKLWTSNPEGEVITIVEAYDEHDEALKIASEVRTAIDEGESLSELAIFYRTNAQSRVLEDLLRAKGINYQIFGGQRFYDRLEVKDSLAYLKILVNPTDDVSFRRVVNVPARGIGAVSLEKFAAQARRQGLSHFELLEAACGDQPSMTLDVGRTLKGFKSFYELIKKLQNSKKSLLPSDLVHCVLEESGYRKMLTDENTVEAQSRIENLAELRQGIVEYELRAGANDPQAPITIEGFLEEIALVSDLDRFQPDAPSLKMMTIHMAKGLEFDRVFIAGLEEELFPNVRPWEVEQTSDVEEERRLFYVGMTRARKKLFLFFAKNRTIFGNSQFRVMSRFIEEIPEEYLELKKADYFARRRGFIDRPALYPERGTHFGKLPVDEYSQVSENGDDIATDVDPEEGEFHAGMRVIHPLFGEGIIRKQVGRDKLLVEFSGRGIKKLSTRFSQLVRSE